MKIHTSTKPKHSHLPGKPNICFACQIKPGEPMYGILLCQECDEEVFIKPYGYRSASHEKVSSISVVINKKHPNFDVLTVVYKFCEWETAVIGLQGSSSKILFTLPGIYPMTQIFLSKISDNLNTYLTFS